MAFVRRTSAGTYRACWRDPSGRQRSKSFKTKRDANRFLAELEASKNRGLYIDPRAGRVRFADYLPHWIVGRHHESNTIARDQSVMRNHVVPRWGDMPLGMIDHTSVQAWIADLASRRSAATVREAHRVFSSVMRSAVRDRIIGHNPCEGVGLPPIRREVAVDRTITRDAFVRQLLPAVPGRYRALVAVAGGTGLRWGECLGLRSDAIDLVSGLVTVRRVVIEVNGRITSKPFPKTAQGLRTVPLPAFVVELLRDHMRRYPAIATGEVFTNEAGGPLRRSTFRRRVWRLALVRAGLLGKVVYEGPKRYRASWLDHDGKEQSAEFRTEPEAVNEVVRKDAGGLRFHDLRHSYATWLVYAGVPINDAQRLLGHSRPSTTLDLYTHAQQHFGPRVGDLFDAFSLPLDEDGGSNRDADDAGDAG
jgi:integrase